MLFRSPNRKFLETIERNTDRLIALVQDLLQLSSLESGGEIGKEKIFLSELTQRVLSQLEPIKNAMGHEIVKTLKAETLNADPRRVEQVLYNLLENAIKYVPPRGKIEVSWAQDNHGVYLSVADNGPGIPLEYRERVFERFYRVDSARSRDQGGTGLGLSIVKHIMQRHGGKIWIEEGPEGKGARFSCFFPSEMD